LYLTLCTARAQIYEFFLNQQHFLSLFSFFVQKSRQEGGIVATFLPIFFILSVSPFATIRYAQQQFSFPGIKNQSC